MNIGIYGGSFNPPHIGHACAAEMAVRELSLDLLLVIPAGVPPHKVIPSGSPDRAARLDMTKIAFENIEKAVVSDIEIAKSGKSYTADTIVELRRIYPGAVFHLIMGADMFLSIADWKDSESIYERAVIVVLSRESDDKTVVSLYAAHLMEACGAEVRIIDNEIVPISSSELREELRHGVKNRYIDDAIYDYIIKNRSYGAKPDYTWLREKATSMLQKKRVPHVLGCEQEAVSLANRWGADEDEAREAAILHDITKKLDLADQLRICEKYGMMLDDMEKTEAKLLHSKTGAAIARAEFGASNSVYDAIMWHTTGRADMSLLEKIIYMADYIEPTRDFEGVGRLRKLAYEDLDYSVFEGLEMSINDMRERAIIPHQRTLEALRFYER